MTTPEYLPNMARDLAVHNAELQASREAAIVAGVQVIFNTTANVSGDLKGCTFTVLYTSVFVSEDGSAPYGIASLNGKDSYGRERTFWARKSVLLLDLEAMGYSD